MGIRRSLLALCPDAALGGKGVALPQDRNGAAVSHMAFSCYAVNKLSQIQENRVERESR